MNKHTRWWCPYCTREYLLPSDGRTLQHIHGRVEAFYTLTATAVYLDVGFCDGYLLLVSADDG